MITLTMQDEKRLDIIQRVYRGELTVVQAALVMGVSERQCFGVGFVHDNCLPMLREKSIRWLEMTPEFGTMDISICRVPQIWNNFFRLISQSLWPSLVKYTAAGVRYPKLMCSLS